MISNSPSLQDMADPCMIGLDQTTEAVIKKEDQNQQLLVRKSDLVVCLGEMLIDFVPTVSGVSLADAPAFKKAPGGAPANVAVAISRLGGHSAFIGKVTIEE